MSHRNRSRGLCCLLAAHLGVSAPTVARGHTPPDLDPRAIELFQKADREQRDEENFEAAVILAERVLQLTDPVHHRDQRGSIIQVIVDASFKGHKQSGRDADLCHLDRVLSAYANEVRETFQDIASRDRILGVIAENRERVFRLVDDGCPSPDTVPEPAADEPTSDIPPRPQPASAAGRTAATEESAQGVDSEPRTEHGGARRQLAAGATLVGMSGVFLGGVGLSVWQFKDNARAIEEIVETLQAEGRPATASERAASEASLAKALTARRLAIGMGITAGLMVLVGVPVLAVGLHRRKKGLRVVPAIANRHAGVTFLGHF